MSLKAKNINKKDKVMPLKMTCNNRFLFVKTTPYRKIREDLSLLYCEILNSFIDLNYKVYFSIVAELLLTESFLLLLTVVSFKTPLS